ncbi:MAG: glucuronate isomerase [Thermoguttaceae bacterium]
MKFIDDNFLLHSPAAKQLFHDFAEHLPIIDYHSHLPPRLIAENHSFSNMTEIWLSGDHYKWRAMRAAGIPERLITGDASDWDKFQVWSEVIPQTLRNPLYHWTHLELRRPLGMDEFLLGPETAPKIWKRGNALLRKPEFSTHGILRQMNVDLVCTTDDPVDSLEYHRAIAADPDCPVQVFPTFRPDRAMNIPRLTLAGCSDRAQCIRLYCGYLDQLGEVADQEIRDLDQLIAVLAQRHEVFHQAGCRLSDHGFGHFDFVEVPDQEEAGTIFRRLRKGELVSDTEERILRSVLLLAIGRLNAEKGWTMQLHIGALRNNRTRAYRELGPDCGCDSMIDGPISCRLSRFLDRLDQTDQLPKTILYNLNSTDSDMLATMIGNFQDGLTPGKMQYGSGWWFLDQKEGMERQLNALSNQGLLSRFVGMLTDSRSFLSFTRHEYFRRILCNLLGNEMETGLLPNNFDLIGSLVRDVCYLNAKNYFGFPE